MAIHTETLSQKHCGACQAGGPSLHGEGLYAMLQQTPHWELIDENKIAREFTFKNYGQTLAFVNRVAELAQAEDHHPSITFTYSKCRIELWTHAVNGLSENDFILAAKIDAI